MANVYNQVIPTANRRKSVKNYQFDHITTAGFMTPMPIAIREVVPNQTLKMSLESFTRLNPLVKPTFGRAVVNNRLFFVPFRTLMPYFTQFLESEPIFSMSDNQFGLQTSVPLVSNENLLKYLVGISSPGTSSDYDMSVLSNGSVVYYKFNTKGKFFYKLLLSLGYKLNFNYDDDFYYSALPLLAYAKVIIDWYYPSQYINNSLVAAVTPYFQNDSLSATLVNSNAIAAIVDLSYCCAYDDYLVVDAWDNPVAPNQGVESAYSIPDVTLPSGIPAGAQTTLESWVTNQYGNNTPVPQTSTSASTNPLSPRSLTQYQHDVLKALTDYTTRHRLAGVRAVDRYLAEYGINLSSEIMKRSLLLGSDSYNIQFGDVMSHSDTYSSGSGAVLGDYAGKGIGYGNHVFDYQLGNEFGYLLVINSVIPQVGYYQGVNPIVKHKSILDFWHADFDGLGVQPVAADEVFMPIDYTAAISLPTLRSKVFGFVPRYSEYKCAPSVLSGDYALPSASADMEAMHLLRQVGRNFASVNDIQHSVDFVLGKDGAQYDRIFYNAGTGNVRAENFNFIHHFSVEQTDETSPLYDTYDFKEVEKSVEVHTQAAKVN